MIEEGYIVGVIMNSFSIGGFKNLISILTKLNDGVFGAHPIEMSKSVIEL